VYDRGNSEVPKGARERCDLDVGTRREQTGTGRKERKEDEECFMRRERQLSIWMKRNKREGQKGTGRNIE
jgi:hypothetical protein